MSAILATLLVIVVAAAAILFYRREQHHREELDQAREEFERRIRKLREEQSAQVDRLERERERIEQTAHLELVDDLLDALDDFDNVLDEQEIDENLHAGLEMIRRKLLGALQAHGVERLEPDESEDFDPERHEALRAIDPRDAEPGTVVTCHRPGYRFQERTLRPAAVDVAVGRDSQKATDADSSSEPDESIEADTEETAEVEPADEEQTTASS